LNLIDSTNPFFQEDTWIFILSTLSLRSEVRSWAWRSTFIVTLKILWKKFTLCNRYFIE